MNAAPSVWPALAAFAAVIALIPIALWILKRLQGGVAGGPRPIRVVGGLSLGPRERLAIVETQGRRWMVGVTPQSITLIAELDAQSTVTDAATPVPAEPASANPFGELLEKVRPRA